MSDTTSTLSELASVIRSKNAGPFWLTLDVFFDSDDAYQAAVDSGAVNAERLGGLYRVDPDLVKIFEIAHLRVIKASMPRKVAAGSFEDSDLHAGQQFVPLAMIEIAGRSSK